ncbi:MAG: hypothetical protein QOI22_24 [Verrucomicrobiota bacterium]
MKVVPSAAGVCVVRDARDLVPFLCGHYLRIGFSQLSFIDDGSSDGTFEFLSELSRRTKRVCVRQVISDQYRQAELMTESANELVARGYQLIVPFDADEFWNITVNDLDRLHALSAEGVFFGRWINFVQQMALTSPRAFGLFHMKFRAPSLPDAGYETVTTFQRPFVCSTDRKVAFKTSECIEIERGQHGRTKEIARLDQSEFEIFHLPLRYRSEITKRGVNYEPRRAGVRQGPSESWQSAFHREVVLTNRIDEVWRANSVNGNGQLDSYGEPIDLISDNRLRRILLSASFYLARTARMIAA